MNFQEKPKKRDRGSKLLCMRERLDVVANRLIEYRDRYDRERDSRAVFTHAYVSITLLIAEHLEKS